MAKLKGRKKLNKAITKLVKPFGVKAKLGSDFAYDILNEHIEYQLTCGEWSDEMFDKFLEEDFGIKNPYPFVLSILHEIGHHMTIWDFLDDDESIFKQKKELAKIVNSEKATQEQKEEAEFKYFRLPDEIAATAWAVDYFTEHRAECDKMYKKACKALRKFYKKNGVTGE